MDNIKISSIPSRRENDESLNGSTSIPFLMSTYIIGYSKYNLPSMISRVCKTTFEQSQNFLTCLDITYLPGVCSERAFCCKSLPADVAVERSVFESLDL